MKARGATVKDELASAIAPIRLHHASLQPATPASKPRTRASWPRSGGRSRVPFRRCG